MGFCACSHPTPTFTCAIYTKKNKEMQPQENAHLSYLCSCKIQLQDQEITVKKKSSWQRKLKTVLFCVAGI